MSSLSCDLNNSDDWFKKLEREYQDFLLNKTSSDKALNFCITAHHMNEWAKSELSEREKAELARKRKLVADDMEIIQDLANGTKHRTLKYETKIGQTQNHKGAFSKGFNRDFDISSLLIFMKSGKKVYFEDVAKNIFDFWKEIYRSDLIT